MSVLVSTQNGVVVVVVSREGAIIVVDVFLGRTFCIMVYRG